MLDPNNPLPKYYQLKEYLKEMIRRGDIAPGEQLPSENALVQQFSLSRHTVRQAIGELENEGWVYREQGRGTFCAYRGKASGRTIAVLTTYISDYIFPAIIRGIEEILSAAGYTLVLANTSNDKNKEAQCLENLINQDIAGLIVEPTKSARENINLAYFAELEKKHIPYLMLHAVYPELDAAYIIMDDQKGGYLATKYLLQLGHREVAGIFKADDLQGVKRQAGFMAALAEYGVTIKQGFLGNYETEQLYSFPYQFTRNLLQKTNRPSAIVCYNDQIALQVLEAIRHEGLKVPEDISLVGYDDSSLAVASEVKLTTIKHPKAEMGRQAARLLIDMLEGRMEKPRLVYEPELVVRSSCRSL
ncbi:Arabinose metabolism transcriptional repressor [Moorella thermoacetica]|uniref:Arabinose metabolism transcriptional repressor n=1 Tax=Neomoorella thermoacetica TaxID=1525 RepID=A0AAC9HH04_NEOTH|nr:GntR family transcriptional regulator [Moorella thermoacetica]AOQ23633.1 Arabinose metabolism transcriptional repressor [Moorella thermoacetica]TYL13817.1 Arabinose metabolism transcriptional repressor [Moorella thermoacetica]